MPLHAVESKLAAAWPPAEWNEVTILVAVSGGADSVALLRSLIALKRGGAGRICAAHLNHQLRGPQSDADETFVVELCRRLGVPCEVSRLEAGQLAAGAHDGLEAAARQLRYAFFRQAALRLGARYVVTGHTADDQAETILHRILRGTGIAGLAGMARFRPLGPGCALARPLLGVRRAELVGYLAALQQPYRSDQSNEDRRFTRNRIRHDLLPRLRRDFNPSVVDALLRLGAMADEVYQLVEHFADQLGQRCVTRREPREIRIDRRCLAGQPHSLIRQVFIAVWKQAGWPLQAMGFAQWELLARMASPSCAESSPGSRRRFLPGDVLVEVQEDTLLLRRSDA